MDVKEIVVRFPAGKKDLYLLNTFRQTFTARSTAYSVGTGYYFRRVKQAGAMKLTIQPRLATRPPMRGDIHNTCLRSAYSDNMN